MAYSTVDEIRALLTERVLMELTDDDRLGAVDETIVSEAIARADAEIDAYCGGRYRVPFASAPEIVRRLSSDLAAYHLYGRRVEEMPPLKAERYRAAIKTLADIARGLVSLGVAEPPDSPGGSMDAATNTPDDTNVFSRRSMEGF